MRSIKIAAMALSLLLLSGCNLHSIKGDVGGVDVQVSDNNKASGKHSGKFCPPGQAKKGLC
ncbi:hypothetical protein SIN8267_01083 [Sinobacterium norvegicum]|uniref:Lipoprotein n=1 Tax=Sinobacterium norvegicum TaxID=1641715 RepID=A0ABN8EJC5_9GAMM|nr:hypothetical protein [Sinobacterium norvegicum]CAH0990982.1 hypothetical protein SIN8267_01083 [Sinobacterium norvegicum]